MRATLLLISSALLILEVLPATGQAQLIDVGPGYVRAPFVRVQRRGRLRARFQTPVANIEGGGSAYQSPQPALQPPPVPPATPLQSVNVPSQRTRSAGIEAPAWHTLRRMIISGETELDQQLLAMQTGPSYRSQLRVGQLRELLQNLTSVPTGETRRQLQAILDVYNQTLIDPNQRTVARLSGFEKVQAGLMQLLAPVDADRSRYEQVHIEGTPSPAMQPRVPSSEPQPTQVLPAVRDSY